MAARLINGCQRLGKRNPSGCHFYEVIRKSREGDYVALDCLGTLEFCSPTAVMWNLPAED
jgi:hypothetical protein